MHTISINQLRWLLLSALVIIFDQLSKWLASHYLVLDQPVKILPVFNLTYMLNSGAAFGFLRDSNGWQRWLFIMIALIISVFIVRALNRLSRKDNATACALALILGGAVGNFYDRVVFRSVTDFISLHIGNWYFATFNIADSAITAGVIVWFLAVWRSNHASNL